MCRYISKHLSKHLSNHSAPSAGFRNTDKSQRLISVLVITLAVFFSLKAESASARNGLIFGSLQAAPTVGDDIYKIGASALIGDDATSVYGSFAYGFGMFTEGRIRFGVSDPDRSGSDPAISIGAELKYQFWNYSENPTGFADPLDLSLSGAFEFASYDPFSITSWSGNVIGSRPFHNRRGHRYGPYGRFNARFTTVNPAGSPAETDIEFAISPGFYFQFSPHLTGQVEFSFDRNTGIAFGFDFGPF